GLALFFRYLAAAWRDASYEDLSYRYLDQAIDGVLTATPLTMQLHGGFTGVAWVAEHILGRFDESLPDDSTSAIDELLCDLLRISPWSGDVGRLVGYGIYALERFPCASATQCLAVVVDRFAE